MKVTVEFEDNDHEYSIDFFKLAKYLKITDDQIRQAVQKIMSKS